MCTKKIKSESPKFNQVESIALLILFAAFFPNTRVNATSDDDDEEIVKKNIGGIKTSSKTDDEVVQRLVFYEIVCNICLGNICM